MVISFPDREVVFKLEDRTRKCRFLHFVVGEAEGRMLEAVVLHTLKEICVAAK